MSAAVGVASRPPVRTSSFSLLFLSSMVSMLLLQGSESLLLLPPPPEPPPFVFLLDLLTGVSAPDPPDPPDASETLALDLSSFLCHCFHLSSCEVSSSFYNNI
ncbi:hypothetical protein Rs2_45129 [Raphanus sativus]|nr:hypothetical protein Rs2_45129 [Raphanus sativus]